MVNKNKVFQYLLVTYITFTSIIIVWELVVYFFDISQIIIVKPSQIYPVIFENCGVFMRELKFTGIEVVLGWFVGSLSAFLLSILIFKFNKLSNFFVSLGIVINAVPLIALAAILGGIFGTDQFGKTIIVVLLCFFPMLISTLKGFSSVKYDYDVLFKSYASNELQRFFKLVLPSSFPIIFNTLRVNVVTAIFAGIVGEFFGAHGGIGNFILAKKGVYELPMVWGAIFYVIVFGSLFYFFVSLIYKIVVPWREK